MPAWGAQQQQRAAAHHRPMRSNRLHAACMLAWHALGKEKAPAGCRLCRSHTCLHGAASASVVCSSEHHCMTVPAPPPHGCPMTPQKNAGAKHTGAFSRLKYAHGYQGKANSFRVSSEQRTGRAPEGQRGKGPQLRPLPSLHPHPQGSKASMANSNQCSAGGARQNHGLCAVTRRTWQLPLSHTNSLFSCLPEVTWGRHVLCAPPAAAGLPAVRAAVAVGAQTCRRSPDVRWAAAATATGLLRTCAPACPPPPTRCTTSTSSATSPPPTRARRCPRYAHAAPRRAGEHSAEGVQRSACSLSQQGSHTLSDSSCKMAPPPGSVGHRL